VRTEARALRCLLLRVVSRYGLQNGLQPALRQNRPHDSREPVPDFADYIRNDGFCKHFAAFATTFRLVKCVTSFWWVQHCEYEDLGAAAPEPAFPQGACGMIRAVAWA
jgi:hypothetical protein